MIWKYVLLILVLGLIARGLWIQGHDPCNVEGEQARIEAGCTEEPEQYDPVGR